MAGVPPREDWEALAAAAGAAREASVDLRVYLEAIAEGLRSDRDHWLPVLVTDLEAALDRAGTTAVALLADLEAAVGGVLSAGACRRAAASAATDAPAAAVALEEHGEALGRLAASVDEQRDEVRRLLRQGPAAGDVDEEGVLVATGMREVAELLDDLPVGALRALGDPRTGE